MIPQGYKHTELGIIPQEWEVKSIGEIAKCFSGGTPNSKDAGLYGGGIPFIRSGEIHSDSTAMYLTEEGLNSSSAKIVDKGDLLFALYGANSGDCAISQINGAINQAILCIRSNSVINAFLQPYLELQKDKYIAKYLQGGQGNLSNELVCSYTIPVPPVEEQRKIAEILCVWDKAIELQARLVDKLELRKRALMQRLLTGGLRFPGFSGPWQKVYLSQIALITKGVQYNKILLQEIGLYPVINGGITPSGYTDKYNTEANTITISEGGNSCGYVNYISTHFWCGGHCYTVKEKELVDKLYLYYLLKYHEPMIMQLRVGSGLPNIQIKPLQKYKLQIPSLAEQTAIAEVLSTADKEIEIAKAKLAAYRTQKRGLMQQLLTGKKRVK